MVSPLLQAHEPQPFETCNRNGSSPLVLTCEHAGRRIPAALGDLGLAAEEMERHIAYDIGAEQLARRLSSALEAVLVLQPYSRLVADCNRPETAPDCVPEVSDGTEIPANRGLTATERRLRFDGIHRPFHDEVRHHLDRRQSSESSPVLIALHSFTPRLRNEGLDRPWHIGLLHNRDTRLSRQLMPILGHCDPALKSAYNEPYSVDDFSDYTIPVHGERRGIPHVLIEIRNDLIADASGQDYFAELFATVIGRALKERESHS